MKSLLPEKYHQSIYLFALILLVIGLPTSKFLMSLSQIILICNWLLEGNVKNKFVVFWNNKTALVISSILLLHFLGILYSDDISYALNDIRIKFPLLVLPIIIATSKPLSQKYFNAILKIFIATVVFSTVVSTLILIGVIDRPIIDTRDISIFISHIRFSLLICVAIFISGYFIEKASTVFEKLIWVTNILWLFIFLVLLESLTGLSVLFLTLFLLAVYYLLKSKNKLVKYGMLAFLFASLLSTLYIVNSVKNNLPVKEVVGFDKLEKHTALGNIYSHDTASKAYENGHFIWVYYSTTEIESAWNKRSDIKIGNKDLKGNDIYYTLVRFLASKGLRKDAAAISLLTMEEVQSIERGVANVNYQTVSNLKGRIHEVLWELDVYNQTGDANGHSLTQRFEYWKTAISIIKRYPIFGVGTGDIDIAFEEEYNRLNSSLNKEWRLRSHNQFLSITVAFGVIGLLWFLISLLSPLWFKNTASGYLYISFLIIAMLSFLTEDTLETQAGVTFFAFFNSFFLFGKEDS